MVYERVAGFLDELKQKPYRQVAIFAHCGVLLCAGIYGGLFKEEGCFEHTVEYGGIEEIEIRSSESFRTDSTIFSRPCKEKYSIQDNKNV